MALFKIFKGTSLTSDNKSGLEGLNKKVSTATEGFCYFTTDDGKMYIDISNNLSDRVCLNANMADQLRTARKIKLTGDATGEASFNGTTDAEIAVEISGLDDLSEAINTKATVGHGIYYGTCTTAAGTAAKVVTLTDATGFKLETGSVVIVKFTYANSIKNPTLNVNNTGAKAMKRYGTTSVSTSSTTSGWSAGAVTIFVYDGTNWVRDYWSNSTYSQASLGQGYGTCDTAKDTAAKVVTLTDYALVKNGIVSVQFTYDVPANATMNINDKGTKSIYYKGVAIKTGIISAGDIATFIYDGTQYHLIGINDLTLSDMGITATKEEINKLTDSIMTTTELNYLSGVTSSIQTQINNLNSNKLNKNANAASASKWASKMALELSGDASGLVSFDGSAKATLNVEIGALDDLGVLINTNKDNLTTLTTTINTMNANLIAAIDKKLDKTDNATTATRATTAGTADKVANQLIIGNQVFDGATEITVTAKDLGLTGAMVYKGISTTAITDGGTQAPTIGGSSVATNTLQAGNVVLYGNQEFVWNGSKWELLGDEGSYKVKQTAVTDPTADGYEVSFIDSLSQDINGKITATKKTVVSASTTTNGLMTTDMVTKLNGIATGANKYSLPVATSSVLGGIKSGGDISITSAGIVTVPQISTNGLGTDGSTHDLNTLYLAGKFKFWNLSSNGTYNNAPGGTVTGTRIGLYCYPISSSAFVQEAMINGKKYFRVSTNGSTNDPVTWANWELCLSGNTLTNNLFIQGTNPYLGFKNSSGVAKGYVQYIQNTDTYAFGAGADNSLKVSATGSISIPANQTFTPATNNTGTIGTTDKKWNNIYATTFTGNLSGTATKATQDGDGKTISSTYLKLSGGTMTGDLALLTGDHDRFIVWDYSTSDTSKGASWRIGELGTGSGNTNYFVIQTTGSSTGSTETYANAMRIGMNNKDVAFFGDVSTSGNISTSGDASAKIITASEKFIGALEGNASSATTLQTTRTINGMSFNGSANVTNYGVCGTDAAVVAKTVTVGSTFILAEGAQVVVKFTNTNSATNPTLSVNGTDAKPIKQYGDTAIGSGATTSAWEAGSVQTFTFDGTSWVRDYWSNTTYTVLPITQTVSTDNVEYPLLSRTTELATTSNGHANFADGVTLNPSTKTITATTFKGNLTGNVTGNLTGDVTGNLTGNVIGNLTGDVTGNVSGSSGSCTGNAATATKLQTAQTIKLTGDVTGSASFTGDTECSISATVADDSHNHTYLPVSGREPISSPSDDTIQNWSSKNNNSTWWYGADECLTDQPATYGFIQNFAYGSDVNQIWFTQSGGKVMRRSGNASGWNGTWRQFWLQGDSVTGAVWNDYAECRESNCEEAGYVLAENGDDTLSKTQERLASFAGVSSDTWGFSQGETERARTPIAVAGRVLVYPYQDRNNYKPGDCVCAAPNGTVDIMTREEVINWPDRIVGTVSCVPEYDEWGGGKNADRDPVKVNGRIWIKIR